MKIALTHGKIYVEALHFEEALLIEDGFITYVGKNNEVLTMVDENTNHIDLMGKTLVPGFNDSHLHFYNTANVFNWIYLKGLDSINAMVEHIKTEYSKQLGPVVYGMGWNQENFEVDMKRFPNRHDLDAIKCDRPMVLYRMDGHMIVCNTLALSLMMDIEHPQQIYGGEIVLDENGHALGILIEKAVDLLTRLPQQQDPIMIMNHIESLIKLAHKQGITSVQVNDLMIEDEPNLIEEAYLNYSKNNPKIRVTHQICFKDLESFKKRIETGYVIQNDSFLRYGPLKLFADGTLGARTAALLEPYEDDPVNKGILTLSEEELSQWIHTAHQNKVSVVLHVIGDRTLDQVLRVFASLNDPHNTLRHGIIHLQITNDELLQRVKDLNLIAYVQPIFLHQDLHILEKRIGKKRASRSYAFKTLIDLGCISPFSSDSPIESFNVFENIHCAVLRQDLNGFPEAGFYPEECVSISDAIDAYTIAGAYASHEEHYKGRIKKDFLADLVVLSQDIFTIDTREIKYTEVEMTFIQGELVYQRVQ
jgi:predicted amidohydrolase YtcJ